MASDDWESVFSDAVEAQEQPPSRGVLLLVGSALWLLKSAIAITLALLIWGDVWGPPVVRLALASLGVVALHATIMALGVVAWFRRVNYVNLYATFAAGLWLYRSVQEHVLPADWLAYSWVPFLLLAPLMVMHKLPGVDLRLCSLLSPNVNRYVISLAMYGTRPFLVIYAILHGRFHPVRSLSYLSERPARIVAAIVLIGLFAFVVAVVSLPTGLAPLVAWAVMIWALVPIVVWSLVTLTLRGTPIQALASSPQAPRVASPVHRTVIGMISITTALIKSFAEGTQDRPVALGR